MHGQEAPLTKQQLRLIFEYAQKIRAEEDRAGPMSERLRLTGLIGSLLAHIEYLENRGHQGDRGVLN